ncbi:MAG: AI-2E family transporter [Ectothiorhodospiraceae bacterium]|nr:AI-2E family transporter [Ectothiorhodospiraceae bacterium]
MLNLTKGEERLLRYTLMVFSAVALACLIVFVVWVLGRVIATFNALLLPLAVAGVIALVLAPVVEFLQRHLRLSRLAAVSSLFATLFLAVIAVLLLVVPTALAQVAQFLNAVPDMAQQGYQSLGNKFPAALRAAEDALGEMELQALLPEAETAAERTFSYIGIAVGLGFVPLYVFFALIAGNRLRDHVEELLFLLDKESQDEVLYLGGLFVNYMTAFFRGQLIIAMLMGVMLATGFTLVGLQAAILFGLALGLLNIVPYLGVIVGLLTVLPVAYIQPDGGIQLVGLVLLVFVVVQFIESFLLTPKIMADQSGLHPALVVISILFWGIALGGVIGMILAVPLTAFLVTLWKHVKTRFQRTLPASESRVEVPPD